MRRRVAIVKPDHIGDLVLAVPAINWISRQEQDATLFAASPNMSLAKYLFPELAIEPLDLPYLVKGGGEKDMNLGQDLRDLRDFDTVVFLRHDSVLNRVRVGHLVRSSIYVDTRLDFHESFNHRMGIRVYFGDYQTLDNWHGHVRPFPVSPRRVGLCIGSGFPSNKWSVIRWVELGRALIADNIEISVIGGNKERSELSIIAQILGLDERQVIVGNADVGAFLSRVADLDLVIASDGGSGHLCSLVTPILLISASTPFRRYAPFGCATRVISLDLPCSPCLNADSRRINACFSYECSYGVVAQNILEALDAPDRFPGDVYSLSNRTRLFYAPSHAMS